MSLHHNGVDMVHIRKFQQFPYAGKLPFVEKTRFVCLRVLCIGYDDGDRLVILYYPNKNICYFVEDLR